MDVEFTFLAHLSDWVFYHLSFQDHRQGNRSLLNYMLCCWKWYNTEVKSAALESERSWFKSQLFHFLTVWPWVGPLTSLSRNRARNRVVSMIRWAEVCRSPAHHRWLPWISAPLPVPTRVGMPSPYPLPSLFQQWPTHNGCSMNACWSNTKKLLDRNKQMH